MVLLVMGSIEPAIGGLLLIGTITANVAFQLVVLR